MDELIEALTILRKYSDAPHPTSCDHDVLMVPVVKWHELSEEDAKRLDELGFHDSTEYECVCSFRFGSC
jgi:hypothetical protein